MNPLRPTLAELRTCVHKDRHREIGNWLARRVARPTAVYGCWLAIRLGSIPRTMGDTWLALTLAGTSPRLHTGTAPIGTGTRTLFVLGVILAYLAFWLDHVDGQVARWRGTASPGRGLFLTISCTTCTNLALGFRPGIRAPARSLRRRSLDDSGIPDRDRLDISEPAQRLSL